MEHCIETNCFKIPGFFWVTYLTIWGNTWFRKTR